MLSMGRNVNIEVIIKFYERLKGIPTYQTKDDHCSECNKPKPAKEFRSPTCRLFW